MLTSEEIIQRANILIVDDVEANVRYLERLLRGAGARQVVTTTDSREILALYHRCPPDLIVLDLMMPHLDGFAVLTQLQSLIPPDTYLPVLVVTADITPEAKRRALQAGARDFLTKPFDAVEALLRIGNLLETRALHQALAGHNIDLKEQVVARTQAWVDAQFEILERLVRAAEYRDDQTGQHTCRVGALAAQVAQQLDWPAADVELLRLTAPLHDLGKIAVADSILRKPGKLTSAEFAVMQQHTTIGAALLAEGQSPLLRMAEAIAGSHHERWDGTGYPAGLRGVAIPFGARIVAVVDVFDALTHARPYKPAWPLEAAVAEISAQSGRHFDPQVVTAFLATLGWAGSESPGALEAGAPSVQAA